jgi:hypothetical protein
MLRVPVVALILLLSSSVHMQMPSLDLPSEARDMLNVKFPDWKYADVSEEVSQCLKKDAGPNARPDLISGDFDGDGRADFAAMIVHGVRRVEDGCVVGPDPAIVVFLAEEHGFRLNVIDDPGGEYLMLIRKGEKRYDYELQKEFTFEHDAIDAIIFEKGATSYVYEQGRFRAIITGD